MKRLLMIAAAVLAFAGAASAANMPKELQGSWCKTTATDTTVSYQWTAESCPPGQDEISIDPAGFRVFLPDVNCRLKSSQRNRWTFYCVGHEGGHMLALTWTRKRDVLTIKELP
jgi:hypothetical protein